MPDVPAYRTIMWSGKPLYVCPACAFQRFNEATVQAHCATCVHLATLRANAPRATDASPAPPPAPQATPEREA